MQKVNKDFLLGAATAAHQVEGNNIHSDYWAMEQMENTMFAEPSLDTVDHYNRYEEDIKLMSTAGMNAYRFSIEWARIEPSEDTYVEEEIEHYRKVIQCCKDHGIEPIVTLHHFSSPKWLIDKGGWEAESTIEDFRNYTRYVMERLGSELKYVCTINEANMGLQIAKIGERYRRQMMAQMAQAQSTSAQEVSDGNVQMGLNLKKMMENQQAVAKENLEVFGVEKPDTFTSTRTKEGDLLVMRAHQAAKAVIKVLAPHIRVGLTLSLHDMQVLEPGGEVYAKEEWDDEFTHYLPYILEDDFLGVQNYTRSIFGANGPLAYPNNAQMTQMNYEVCPEALENVIRKVAEEFKGELMVTENGIAVDDDQIRIDFIDKALEGVVRCINDEIPVTAYCYWSLLDNFEWQKGYSMTFGLIAVDRTTQKRIPKDSLYHIGKWRS